MSSCVQTPRAELTCHFDPSEKLPFLKIDGAVVLDGTKNGSEILIAREYDPSKYGDNNIESSPYGSKDSADSGICDDGKGDIEIDGDLRDGFCKDNCKVEIKSDIDVLLWKKVTIIFFTLNVFIVITICVIVFCVQRRRPVNDHGNYCLRCSDLHSNLDNIDNVYGLKEFANTSYCCSNNITLLAQKYTIQTNKRENPELPTPPAPRTAVHLKLDDPQTISDGETHTLKWRKHGSLSFGNLTLSSNGREMFAIKAGTYSMTSQVVFELSKSLWVAANQHLAYIRHQLIRRRQGLDLMLVDNIHSQCAGSSGSCEIPSLLHRIVKLKEGDAVFVRVKKPGGYTLISDLGHLDLYMV